MTIYLDSEVETEYFGDESNCGSIVVFGFVGFSPDILDKALDALNEIKKQFKGNEEAEIHCRSLFAGDNRAKSKWSHLVHNQPQFLCLEIARAMRALGVKSILCKTDKTGLPSRIDLTFENSIPKPTKAGHELGDKQLQQYLYTCIVSHITFSGKLGKVKIWVDPDTTKIDWFNGKKQAKNLLDLVKPTGFDPGKYKPLLEIADIFVYAAARYHANDRRKGWMIFKMIYNCFSPVVLMQTFTPATWDSVRNE